MKIAIHNKESGFSKKWISYCEKSKIQFGLVNCYRTDILKVLYEYDGLMWHFHQSNSKDVLFAKQLMYALYSSGYPVFPDFHTCWHFDDKIGQKYLLESISAPFVPSYIFYNREIALTWIEDASFPKVFKLRTGAGSANVQFVKNKKYAKKLINKAFSTGFRQYDPLPKFEERWRKFRLGKTGGLDILKAFARFFYSTDYERISGREKGYVYFQDFIPGNEYDIRVNIIDGKASAVRRKVRENDFRASGSGFIDYDMSKIPQKALEISFEITEKLKMQSVAFDFVMDQENPLIVEMSYGFGYIETDFQIGYWDSDLNFHEGSFNPFGWMVDSFIKEIKGKSKNISS